STLNLNKSTTKPIWINTLSKSGPSATGHYAVSIVMPTWKGANETLEFRINDKLEQLYFQCTPNDMQMRMRQHGIDFKDEQRPVDLLIGLDNINKLQLSEELRLNDDVIAKRTTIGWVIFGVQLENKVRVSNDPVTAAPV
ncbi:hypothetical protein BLA29_013880, partial [Euroglyphus maynei]